MLCTKLMSQICEIHFHLPTNQDVNQGVLMWHAFSVKVVTAGYDRPVREKSLHKPPVISNVVWPFYLKIFDCDECLFLIFRFVLRLIFYWMPLWFYFSLLNHQNLHSFKVMNLCMCKIFYIIYWTIKIGNISQTDSNSRTGSIVSKCILLKKKIVLHKYHGI